MRWIAALVDWCRHTDDGRLQVHTAASRGQSPCSWSEAAVAAATAAAAAAVEISYDIQGSGGAAFGGHTLMIVFNNTVKKRRVKVKSNDFYQEVDVQFVSEKMIL